MIPRKSFVLLTVPPTLEKRLEALEAIRTLAGQQDEEAIRQRRAEIAELRRIHGELVLEVQELRRALDPRLRSYVMWRAAATSAVRSDSGAQTAVLKARPDDPEHPGWPAGAPEGRGGKFRPKDGEAGGAVEYAAAGAFPPPPPGYDPKTWKQGQWPNGKHWLEDPDRNKYTAHPEDDTHWRHWDIQDSDGNDKGQWPPSYKKPWPTQKKKPDPDQSLSDPSGDTPPWDPSPFAPVVPILPRPIPEIPIFPRIFVPAW